MVKLDKNRFDFVIVAPLPWIRVLTASVLLAATLGMVTVGLAPKAPLADTVLFAGGGLDEPQPASTKPAISGTTMSATMRRMVLRNLAMVGKSAASLLGARPYRMPASRFRFHTRMV